MNPSKHSNQGFGKYLDRTIKKMSNTYYKAFKQHGVELTIEQWVILQQIYLLDDKASQVEISKMSYRNRATTSRVISGLCKKGLVMKERFNGDLKRFKLVLTAEGREVVDQVLPIVHDLRKIGYQNISEQEFGVFMKVLEQIWENYHAIELTEVD